MDIIINEGDDEVKRVENVQTIRFLKTKIKITYLRPDGTEFQTSLQYTEFTGINLVI